MSTGIVRDQMYQLNVHKSLGPGWDSSQNTEGRVDVRAGPLSIIYQMSWDSGEGPADWKPDSVLPT